MAFVGIVEHNGIDLTVVDISHCEPADSVRLLKQAIPLVKQQPKSSVLLLTNVENTVYNKDVFPYIKDYVVSNIPFIKGSAVVGIDGMKKAIFNTLRFVTLHEIKQFKTEIEARDWLATL
ncbi:MAG: hypothetical protein GX577_00195 [Leptolinea sp.]|nr:hypothetical protein [Leptolinea sp.]